MFIQITIITLICLFYIIYVVKMLLLKKQGISVDLLGKGDKPKKAACIEIILKSITYVGAIVQITSAFFSNHILSFDIPAFIRVIGIVSTATGVFFFLMSITIMRNNWRAGFDKNQSTALVTNGIYKISRNPAFVGFDLLYIGCVIAFPNMFNILITFVAILSFHVQILGEEKFLFEKFGQEYLEYKDKVRRYF